MDMTDDLSEMHMLLTRAVSYGLVGSQSLNDTSAALAILTRIIETQPEKRVARKIKESDATV